METLPPPLGGDVNRGQTFIILVAVLGFVSVITTVLRVGVRIANHQQGWDDYTIALATLLLLIQVVLSGLQYHAGIGRHMVYLSLDQNMDALKWSYVTILLFFVAVCLTKVSICLFILRIKKTGWLKWVLYTLMTGLVITTAAPEIILFMQCQPYVFSEDFFPIRASFESQECFGSQRFLSSDFHTFDALSYAFF